MVRKLHIGGKLRQEGWEVLNALPGDYVDHIGDARDLAQFAEVFVLGEGFGQVEGFAHPDAVGHRFVDELVEGVGFHHGEHGRQFFFIYPDMTLCEPVERLQFIHDE